MLRVTPSTSPQGAKRYFGENLTRSDYYIEGQEIAGQWGGKAAQQLGLSGQVDAQGYFALCDNLDPQTGRQLTPRLKDNRRVGYDFTFSAPKSVSVLYELSGDDRILEAFRASVKDTMQEMEAEMKTRVRAKGRNEDRLTGNMVWAEFVHFTSRPVEGKPDPHLHAHCFAFNTTFDEKEKRFKAGQFGDLKRDASYFEAAFDARLAHRLNGLGYATEKGSKYSFELAGVPGSVIDRFSRRRNQIEAEAAAKGIVSAQGKHSIGYYGRERKTLEQSKAELREEWALRLSGSQSAALQKVIRKESKAQDSIRPEAAMDHAIRHCFERASTLSEKALKAEALRHGVGSVLPEEIDRTASRPELLKRDVDGETLVTTRDVLREENAMLSFARQGRGRFAPFGSGMDGLSSLSGEQKEAALQVIRSRDRVVGIRGGAGTGKSHMMKATIREAIEGAAPVPGGPYSKVFVFAPSAQASRVELRKGSDGFKDAETVERLLVDEQLQGRIRGQVLWIDEAGLLSSKDMRRVFELAERQNSRVILSGDYRQHTSVNRGDAFRLLESEAGVKFAELKEIRRQKTKAYRDAVEVISDGTATGAAKGYDRLKAMGSIIEAEGPERHRLLVGDYLKAVQDEKSALVIAPTHKEGRELTQEIRSALKETGQLGAREHGFVSRVATNWTQAQRADARNYEEGQVVQFMKATSGQRKRTGGIRQTLGGFARGESAVVLRQGEGGVVVQRQDGTRAYLPLEAADRFQVYRTEEIRLARNDRIRLTMNGEVKTGSQIAAGRKGFELKEKSKRLNNGDIHTIQGFTAMGDIKLEGGIVLPKSYGHFTYGYVDTSHASQGKTVDRVFLANGAESFGATNRAQWYVSVSRGREAIKVYTDNAQELRELIQRSPDRLSAVEMMKKGNAGQERRPFDLRAFAFERNRVGRYLKARADETLARFRPVQREERKGLQYGR